MQAAVDECHLALDVADEFVILNLIQRVLLLAVGAVEDDRLKLVVVDLLRQVLPLLQLSLYLIEPPYLL